MSKKRTGKVKGMYDEKSAKFGFAEWNLKTHEEYQEFIKRMISEGVKLATKEYECYASFLSQRGGKEPTTIYVELPLGEDEDGPRWFFNLKDLVENEIACWEQGPGGPIDEDHVPYLKLIGDSLRELADQIYSALNRSPQNPAI